MWPILYAISLGDKINYKSNIYDEHLITHLIFFSKFSRKIEENFVFNLSGILKYIDTFTFLY